MHPKNIEGAFPKRKNKLVREQIPNKSREHLRLSQTGRKKKSYS